MRRVVAAIPVVVLLAVVGWTLLGWPPLRYVLRYGLTPGCGPTGQTRTVEGVTFVEIGPGVFRMGSTYGAVEGDLLGRICGPLGLPWGDQPEPTNEMPVHWVEFRRGFWIAETELTKEQWLRLDPDLGLYRGSGISSPGDGHPVALVNWVLARQYCAWLAEKSGLPVRLPSEAEWECACRAGSQREFSFGDEKKDLDKFAWFKANSGRHPHEVATRLPNSWGLYDLHGNLWEWCEDIDHANYEGAPTDGSAWTEGGHRSLLPAFPQARVLRGGGWGDQRTDNRSATRTAKLPDFSSRFFGFRPAFSLPDD